MSLTCVAHLCGSPAPELFASLNEDRETTMTKSIAFTAYGSTDVLHIEDVELPPPGPGQVRIAVRTAGVNPLDHKIRAGYMRDAFPVAFPHVPGAEGAGVVEAVGEGVAGIVVGDEVFGRTVTGTYAEQAVADADKLTLKPDSLSWEQAAAVVVAAETSYRTLERLGVRPGETVLIHGAAGGVGTVAVQFALARGATVIGTASERNHAYLRSLGATPVLYGDGLVERVRAVAPDGVDAALDTSGQEDAVLASIELTGGTDRVLEIANPMASQPHGVAFSAGGPAEDRGQQGTEEALALFAAGKLLLPVHRTFPLEQAAQAQQLSADGHVSGKIVLTV
jgi:NADPH:quinone reductase-like Zn-dependent oxidoreductase